jgi:hypothetical protein
MDSNIGLPPGRLYNLICAVAGEEITTREFRSALSLLPSESVGYVGTVLALQASLRERASTRLSAASAICRAFASAKASSN